MAKKIECLEDKIEDNKKKDKHTEHKFDYHIDKLKHKIKHLEKEFDHYKLKYKTIVYRLQR